MSRFKRTGSCATSSIGRSARPGGGWSGHGPTAAPCYNRYRPNLLRRTGEPSLTGAYRGPTATASPTPSPSAHLAGHWAWCEVPGATADTRFDRWAAPACADHVARPRRGRRRRGDERAGRGAAADDLAARWARTAWSGGPRRDTVPRKPSRDLRRPVGAADHQAA